MTAGGSYIANRYLPRIIRDICAQREISFRSFSDDWVLELSKDGHVKRITGYTFDINSAAATAIANDKVAAYQLMAAHGVAALEHLLYRPENNVSFQVPAWRPLVVKPLTGTGGNDVRMLADWREAEAHMASSKNGGWAISPYVKIEREVRSIILDGETLLSYEKVTPNTDESFTLFNLSMGASPRPYELPDETRALVQKAQAALGLRLAAVDCIELSTGGWRVLEVNAGIMMEYYARVSSEFFQQATGVYRRIIDTMMA